MEHKPGMSKMEPDAAEVALSSLRCSLQQPVPASPTATRIKEERPDPGDGAFLNFEGSGLARRVPEALPLIPAENSELLTGQIRRSRIPGRDHRRYYQERWRMEYLMDYDCLRHGLVCMVCGSALATLKLSTIKRHILQKHRDSLLLTPTEREVVMATWVEHLLSHSYLPEETDGPGPELHGTDLDIAPVRSPAMDPLPAEPALTPEPPPALTDEPDGHQGKGHPPGKEPPLRLGLGLDRPVKRVRRYYQERWRMEYLMDYDCLRHGLVCMVCGSALATLKLSTIKRHILQKHRASLLLTPTEREVVMATWVQHLLNQSQVIEQQGAGLQHLPNQSQIIEQQGAGLQHLPNQSQVIEQQGAGLTHLLNQSQVIEQQGVGLPHHLNQSQVIEQQGAVLSHLLNQSLVTEQQGAGPAVLLNQSQLIEQQEAVPAPPTGGSRQASNSIGAHPVIKMEVFPVIPAPVDEQRLPPENPRPPEQNTVQQTPLPRWSSKGVRRYYQERWRFDYLMDYERWRHGLVCMVCGKSLATLTLSTIKRHIVQNHPHSLHFSQAEKENILEAWDERAVQLDCPAVQLVTPRLGVNWPAGKKPRRYYQERWRFDYLMDYDRCRQGLVCMVCGKSLATLALSTIKRHIVQNHPHSLHFSQAEKENILEAWSKTMSHQERVTLDLQGAEEASVLPPRTPAVTGRKPDTEFANGVDLELEVLSGGRRSPAEIEVSVEEQELGRPARSRVPGRDHRRNYQERWRLEYLMDYDGWRHGLVCMVCGSALATLKLSTIKRHILQKHRASLGFTLTEKVMVVEEWNKKIAAIAKMDFWQLPGGGNGSPPRYPGVVDKAQH